MLQWMQMSKHQTIRWAVNNVIITIIKLFVRFLECEPTTNSEQSFFDVKNSREFPSSKGVISFLRPRTLQLGLSNFEKSLRTSTMLWLVWVPLIINALFVFSTNCGSSFFRILFTLPFLWKFASGGGADIFSKGFSQRNARFSDGLYQALAMVH